MVSALMESKGLGQALYKDRCGGTEMSKQQHLPHSQGVGGDEPADDSCNPGQKEVWSAVPRAREGEVGSDGEGAIRKTSWNG